MSTIHFSSGKTREIDPGKLDKFIIDLKGRGIKMMINRDEACTLIVPLNSNTMEFIEDLHETVEEEVVVYEDESTTDEPTLEELKEALAEAKEDVDSKKDIEEKQAEQMENMMSKSSCKHLDTVIHRHDTKKGSRFFPVCSFCGKRERYVKAESLSDESKDLAPIWED